MKLKNETNKKVFILTEGGKGIGYGHITRCLSIYEMYAEQGYSPEMIVNLDDNENNLFKRIKHRIINWRLLSSDLLNDITGSIVVIDSYLADISIYRKIANVAYKAIYLDDYIRLNYPKGIVLNGAINASKLPYIKSDNVNYLLGSKYQVLRKPFWRVPQRKISLKVNNVLISFGGEDRFECSVIVLELLTKLYPELKKHVIVGHGFSERLIHQLEEIVDRKKNIVYYADARTMKKIMLKSDIAISAAGQTLYELARTGVPTIAVKVAENQENNVKGFSDAGIIEYAGEYQQGHIFKERIITSIEKLLDYNTRTIMVENGYKIIGNKSKHNDII